MAPKPAPRQTPPEWRPAGASDTDETEPLNLDEVRAMMQEARDAAAAAQTAAAKASKAQPAARAKPAAHRPGYSSPWSLAAVLIVLILAAAGVTVAYLFLVAPLAH